MLQWSRKTGKEERKVKNEKTPVYDGEEGKISPSCSTWDTTLAVTPLSENAALRRLILPVTFCETVLCWLWSEGATDVDFAWPKRLLLKRLATHRECCVASTSMRCFVFSGLRFRHTRKKSCPSSQSPPILVKMNGIQEDSVRRRPFSSLRG